MTRPPARKTTSLLAASVLVACVVGGSLVACSSESTRAPFVAAEPDDTSAPDGASPAPTATATPVTPSTTNDAGATTPDDDCKRAAPSNECGVVPQCGCAPTHTCDVVDSKGTARCITAGKAPMGHPCTATAGCALGLTCIFGTCHAFCNDATKACTQPGTGACAQITAQGGAAVPNLAICRVACALHDPSSCGGNTNAGIGVCYVDDQNGTDCQEGGSRAEGQTCSPSDACGPGLVCTTTNSVSTCKRWCRVGQNDCGGNRTCTGFSPEVKVGDVVYGACP
ncbi:MAG: hypothetical protein KF764_05975 [Labilithrix sp.]|nr:hypothetical protein [Labilithrix sp.]